MKKLFTLVTLMLITSFGVCAGTVGRVTDFAGYSATPSGSEWAAGTKWFMIQNINGNNGTKFYLTPSGGYLPTTLPTASTIDSYLWAFVGDYENGFQLYNKAQGTGSVLWVTSSSRGMAATTTNAHIWDLYTSMDTGKYLLIEHGTEHNALNNNQQQGNLVAWNSDGALYGWNHTSANPLPTGDAGSNFVISGAEEYTVVVNGIDGNVGGVVIAGEQHHAGTVNTFSLLAEAATAIPASDYTTNVSVSGNTITVTYTPNIAPLQQKIDAVYAKKGLIGYPSDMSSLEPYKNSGVNASNFEDARTAYNNVITSSAINLPKDGKAYYFVNVASGDGTMSGTQRYLKYDESNANLSTEIYTEGETEIPESSIFICKDRGEGVTGGRFVFVNSQGHYLRYYGQSNGNNRKGALSEEFSIDDATVNIVRIEKSGNYMSGVNSQADLLGLIAVTGKRADKTHYNAGIVISSTNGGFDGVDIPNFITSSYSTAFRMVEVTNPNTFTLTAPESVSTSLSDKLISTFSAPYDVELPSGVVAHKASVDGYTVNLVPVGQIVPKNEGVLLYAENGDYTGVEAVPATTASTADFTDNAFVAAVGGVIEAGSWVLGNGSKGVAFYALINDSDPVHNKAYIDAQTGANIRSFVFVGEGDLTTGIATPVAQQSIATAYDLAGRRVSAAVKGISIVNGKKFIK